MCHSRRSTSRSLQNVVARTSSSWWIGRLRVLDQALTRGNGPEQRCFRPERPRFLAGGNGCVLPANISSWTDKIRFVVGTSLFQLIKPETVDVIRRALQECSAGSAVSIRYQIKSRRGFVEVVTRFYPRTAIPIAGDDDMDVEALDQGPKHLSIMYVSSFSLFRYMLTLTLAARKQTKSHPSNASRHSTSDVTLPPTDDKSTPRPDCPIRDRRLVEDLTCSPPSRLSTIPVASATTSLMSSTLLDVRVGNTSCINVRSHFHLAFIRTTADLFLTSAVQNINKKLREEKEHLVGRARKRKSDFEKLQIGSRKKSGSSEGSSRAKKPLSCANCGRTDSPEWRAGPTGNKSLCNAFVFLLLLLNDDD